eukprot:Selendium_serpulae@DN2998_c0_g1_i2.p2
MDRERYNAIRGRSVAVYGGLVTDAGLTEVEPLPKFLRVLGSTLLAAGLFTAEQKVNHALVNDYPVGGGIMPHKDGPAYRPIVCITSFGSPVVFDFESPVDAVAPIRFSVYVPPKSLLVFKDEAYTDLLHGIKLRSYDEIDVTVIGAPPGFSGTDCISYRGRRVSLTLRHVPYHPIYGCMFEEAEKYQSDEEELADLHPRVKEIA